MKKVYTTKDPLMIGHLKNVLATFDIKSITKNYELSSAAGELPPIECWPELWVVDDHRHAEAEAILKKTLAPLKSVKKSWQCARLRRRNRRTVLRVLEMRSKPRSRSRAS